MIRRAAVFVALPALAVGGVACGGSAGVVVAGSQTSSAPARAASTGSGLPATLAAKWRKPWCAGGRMVPPEKGCGALFDCLARVFNVGDFEVLTVGYYQGGALPERFRSRVLRCSNAEAGDDQVRYDPTTAGDAAARAALITKADLPVRPGWSWSGRVVGQTMAVHAGCAAFRPRESDLVVQGDVLAFYGRRGFAFGNEVQVFQSSEMLALAWRRSVQAPGALKCLRREALRARSSSTRLVSVGRLRFPHVATYTAAFRAIYDVAGKAGRTRRVVDFVVLGRGKTKVSLRVSWPRFSSAYGDRAEARLARALASRIRS